MVLSLVEWCCQCLAEALVREGADGPALEACADCPHCPGPMRSRSCITAPMHTHSDASRRASRGSTPQLWRRALCWDKRPCAPVTTFVGSRHSSWMRSPQSAPSSLTRASI
ncbi:hypothetical protein HaLaN_03479 [Haematococcus lacustris]|uniref:Uncharacterized protein n=1 Tax=Haematococcus lacustris TaxID=44745 RepID=A0A699YH13_HAELA|nr:hypothetical protein HaLaN_03479 [Haematococcus lacustris]